jgi:hypothetical protein
MAAGEALLCGAFGLFLAHSGQTSRTIASGSGPEIFAAL